MCQVKGPYTGKVNSNDVIKGRAAEVKSALITVAANQQFSYH